jgi:hypothetical protein
MEYLSFNSLYLFSLTIVFSKEIPSGDISILSGEIPSLIRYFFDILYVQKLYLNNSN